MPYRNAPRGGPSAELPPDAFVSFIQNHDQIGNRAFGERLNVLASPEAMRALASVYLLAPQIPMLFMGEEWGATSPFLFFCDFKGELAEAVRKGRREEFSRFPEFADPQQVAKIPDPLAESTFLASKLDWSRVDAAHLAYYRDLLKARREFVQPLLASIRHGGEAPRGRRASRARHLAGGRAAGSSSTPISRPVPSRFLTAASARFGFAATPALPSRPGPCAGDQLSMNAPRATYRLQLHAGFGFRDAAAIAPYLARLGVSHVYLSPIFKARPGSVHGYDVTDHNQLNPELGTENDFTSMIDAFARSRARTNPRHRAQSRGRLGRRQSAVARCSGMGPLFSICRLVRHRLVSSRRQTARAGAWRAIWRRAEVGKTETPFRRGRKFRRLGL